MAPEIVMGLKYDAKVDVWSIGVIAYLLLTGIPPFIGKTKKDIFSSICMEEPNYERKQLMLVG